MMSPGGTEIQSSLDTFIQKKKRRKCFSQTRRVQREHKPKNPPLSAGGYHLPPFFPCDRQRMARDDRKNLLRRKSHKICRQEGSATVEAALALPLFLIVCVMLLSMVDMTRTYVREEEKLYEQTRKAAVYGVIGSAAGIRGSTDMVEFYKPYRAAPPLKGPGFRHFLMVNHCKAHIWNGYDNSKGFLSEEDPAYVYVTEEGSVYHRRRDCSHLNVTIKSIPPGKMGAQRSEDGSRYYACPICTKGMKKSDLSKMTLYVASYGIKYHVRLTCPNIKRTVYVVPFSQVNGKPACSECGQ